MAVGALDIASVGPLTPVCKALKALIEAAEGAAQVADQLKGLVSWCTYLVHAFVMFGKDPANLTCENIHKTLKEFVVTTDQLAKRANVLARRNGCMALACHLRDGHTVQNVDIKLRRIWDDIQGVTTLDTNRILRKLGARLVELPASSVPPAAPRLPSLPYHVKRASLVDEVGRNPRASDAAITPCVLIGVAGAGKTVLASFVVRIKEVKEHFDRGIFWVRVGRWWKQHLQALLEGLARDVCVVETLPRHF